MQLTVGQDQAILGGLESTLEHLGEGYLGHHLLVARDGQTSVDYVEHSLGGALVALGVVHDTLGDAI